MKLFFLASVFIFSTSSFAAGFSYNCTFSINHRGQKIEITETTDLTNGSVFRKTIANRNFEIKMTQGGGIEDLNKNITNIDYSFEGVTFGRLAASGNPDTLYFYNVITGNDGKESVGLISVVCKK